MFTSQHCEWLIRPSRASDTEVTVILEMLTVDMRGGSIEVYDGDSTSAMRIWRCEGCTSNPGLLIGSSGSFYVVYKSSSSPSGKGFLAIYSTITLPTTSWQIGPLLLEYPKTQLMNESTWMLNVSAEPLSLEYSSTLSSSLTSTNNIASFVLDGRREGELSSISSIGNICGFYRGFSGISMSNLLSRLICFADNISYVGNGMFLRPTQRAQTFIFSNHSRTLLNISHNSEEKTLQATRQCKYFLSSGSSFSPILIKIKYFNSDDPENRIIIYGGSNGKDAIAFDSGTFIYR